MSRRTSIYENNMKLFGIRTLDCLYKERLMCLIINFGASNVELIKLFQTLRTTRPEMQHSIKKTVINPTLKTVSQIFHWSTNWRGIILVGEQTINIAVQNKNSKKLNKLQ